MLLRSVKFCEKRKPTGFRQRMQQDPTSAESERTWSVLGMRPASSSHRMREAIRMRPKCIIYLGGPSAFIWITDQLGPPTDCDEKGSPGGAWRGFFFVVAGSLPTFSSTAVRGRMF